MSPFSSSRIVVVLAFFAMFAVQAVCLDADPPPLKWTGDVNDEGFWQHNARCKVLFGNFLPDEFNQSLIGAPLYNGVQWLAFSLLGVSFRTARLFPLVSLWLILAMLYSLMRRSHPPGRAFLIVATLGLMHETLMYARWSTPIVPEMLFLTAILFFWDRAQQGSAWWALMSGMCFVAAAATKLSSVYFCGAMVLFLCGVYWLRREADYRRVLLFFGGAVAAAIPLAVFYWLEWEQFRFFSNTIMRINWDKPVPLHTALYDALAIFVYDAFQSPGVSILAIATTIWLLELVGEIARRGFRPALCRLSLAEFYSLCWLVGTLAALIISPDKRERRFIMFYVPLTILATSFILRQISSDRNVQPSHLADDLRRIPRSWRMALWLLLACGWSYYFLGAVQRIAMQYFDWRIARAALTTRLLGVVVCGLVSLPLVLGRTRALAWGLFAAFFSISLVLNGLWYSSFTFTIRDASRALRQNVSERMCIVGGFSHILAMENSGHPIWPPWRTLCPMNHWFLQQAQSEPFLMMTRIGAAPGELPPDFQDPCPPAVAALAMEEIQQFTMAPRPLTGKPRGVLTVFRVQPSSAGKRNSGGGEGK